ncbi:hypothetical protein NQ314_000936 [Rhamnusium bicolor]|uniref:Integrin alpha first immunoglubulin-like domain-containing protein n=1 Tax=Rhamnusium bicolor TaxID=1586634 RepID=A0AAV8ZTD3_9CUCU|nr:hypothetical protein NQ314_000936 [Rhamnusium bicolor]
MVIFSFKSCFSIVGKIKKTDKFNVNYHIMEEKNIVSRIWFLDTVHVDKRSSVHTQTVVVSSYSKEYCQNEIVYIKEGVSDILSPIKVSNFDILFN